MSKDNEPMSFNVVIDEDEISSQISNYNDKMNEQFELIYSSLQENKIHLAKLKEKVQDISEAMLEQNRLLQKICDQLDQPERHTNLLLRQGIPFPFRAEKTKTVLGPVDLD